jgi:hypothetical protein
MKPREFVARVIELFDINVDPIAVNSPDSLGMAYLQILQASGDDGDIRTKRDGFVFVLETGESCGHYIIRACMFPGNNLKVKTTGKPQSGIFASVCYTVQNFETFGKHESSINIYENYQLPWKYEDQQTEMLDMLAYLTLKTHYKIKRKF